MGNNRSSTPHTTPGWSSRISFRAKRGTPDRALSLQEDEMTVNGYACIHFRGLNEVYILCGDKTVRHICEAKLDELVGIATKKEFSRCMLYIELSGYPFYAGHVVTSSCIATQLRLAASEVLRELFRRGWNLIAASNLTRTNSVTSWFFQKTILSDGDPIRALATSEKFLVVNISSDDKIEILNAKDELLDAIIADVSKHHRHGVEGITSSEDHTRTIQLSGRPFAKAGELKTSAVLLVVRIMVRIEDGGYAFYGTADFKGTSDCLFFVPTAMSGYQFSSYAALTLEDEENMCIVNVDHQIFKEIDACIRHMWTKGVQKSGKCYRGHEWKLKGRPWWCSGREAVESRLLVARIFDVMSAHHYEHYATLDLSRRITDKSSVIFRLHPGKPRLVHAIVSPSSCDKLRLIGFPPGSKLRTSIPETVKAIWHQGVKEVTHDLLFTEIKLRGTPFDNLYTWKSENYARIFMCAILSELQAEGYELISSCDMSAKFHAGKGSSFPTDLDSWIVGKQIDHGRPTSSRGVDSYTEALFDYPELL